MGEERGREEWPCENEEFGFHGFPIFGGREIMWGQGKTLSGFFVCV